MSDNTDNGATEDTKADLEKRLYSFFKDPLAEDTAVVNICKEKAEAGDYNAMLWLARMYRDGKGVEKDLEKAAEWMRKAADKNVGWAKNELFDILWRIGTPEATGEMISVATAFADTGDGNAMGRLGRAYRDGKGVEKDLEKAAEWMRKAADKNVGWAKNELFDILWRIGTPEATGEMISVATAFADTGDGNAMGRLGRAYRDGKGVEKDLEKAAEWMRKAADKNVGWAKNELFDILWRIGTPEATGEMISVATAFADTGDGNAMGRLGRAYRDGKGVEKDLEKAAEWMRKAADKNVGWAKNELFDILWRIGTPEATGEMISVATAFADTGDGNAMGRLGRAYRDGKGVEKDLEKAAEWMRKAADKNVGWAKNELFDMESRYSLDSFIQAYEKCIISSKEGDFKSTIRLWMWKEMYEKQFIITTTKNKNELMNFLIITSAEYVKYCFVLMKSVCLNNRDRKKRFFILFPDAKGCDNEELSFFANREDVDVVTIPIDNSVFEVFGSQKLWPKHIYAQLIPHLFLPEDVDRILYLDVDTIVDDSLDELYDLDFHDNVLAGATSNIFFNTQYLKKKYFEIPHRINAGMVLYNICKMRKEAVDISYYQTLSNKKIINLNSTGESILNDAFKNRILFLDEYEYNRKVSTSHIYKKFSLQREKTKIFHFEGNTRQAIVKPWDCYFENQEGRYSSELLSQTMEDEINYTFSVWWKYAKLSHNYETLFYEMEQKKKFFLGPIRRITEGYLNQICSDCNLIDCVMQILSDPFYEKVCNFLDDHRNCKIRFSRDNIISKIFERYLGPKNIIKEGNDSEKSILILTDPWEQPKCEMIKHTVTHNQIVSVDEIIQYSRESIPKQRGSAFDEIVNIGYDCEASFVIKKYWYNGQLNSFLFSWSLEEDPLLFIDALENLNNLTEGPFSLDNKMVRIEKYKIKFHPRPDDNLYDNHGRVNNEVLTPLIDELKSRIEHLSRKTERLFISGYTTLFISKMFYDKGKPDTNYLNGLYKTIEAKYKHGSFKLLFITEGGIIEQELLDFKKKYNRVEILSLKKYARYPVSNYDEEGWIKIIKEIDPTLPI